MCIYIRFILFLLLINQIVGISYNLPIICSNASWDPNGVTVWNHPNSVPGPYVLFVNVENILFAPDIVNDRIIIWENGTTHQTITAGMNLTDVRGIFVTEAKDIFVSDNVSFASYPILRWTFNGTSLSPIMLYNTSCFSIFIDTNNRLYCCERWMHRITRSLMNLSNYSHDLIAGTGLVEATSDKLNGPRGIFVSLDNRLFVADTDNNRIQVFQLGQTTGETIIGTGSNQTMSLDKPTWVTLDGLGYLFVVDSRNNRIIGSDRYGFRCIVGCSGSAGSASNTLDFPRALAFDTDGNIFIADYSNYRIQKFSLLNNSCDETTTRQFSTEYFFTSSTSNTQQSSTFVTLNSSCTSPTITLIPSTSTFHSPIQFRRSQDFYLSATIQFNCNDSLPFQMQWFIINCTSSSCIHPIQVDASIITTFPDLYMPSRTLPLGLFQLKFVVTVNNSFTSMSAYVQINPSGITANLVRLGTSMITTGYDQNLQLNPGLYSIDTDGYPFNASDWKYTYFCRIYGISSFPHIRGVLLSIDDPSISFSNASCFDSSIVNGNSWRFDGVSQSIKSSVTILPKSLRSNRTYQWMVFMENKRNNSLQATGYLLSQLVDTRPQMIVIGCIISILCVPNLEFQLINPTTQVALYALCLGQCSFNHTITWNIYEGSSHFSSNVTRWTLFNQTNIYRDRWFFGENTSNFTATNQLFLTNPQVDLWRFEVIYSFSNVTSSSSLNFIMNPSPSNGSCSIFPPNGTMSTLFTISCPDWFDSDDVKDYLLYTQSSKPSERILIAFSIVPTFTVRLPQGTNHNDELHLMIYIRDRLDCTTEFNLTSVIVKVDSQMISTFIDQFQNSSSSLSRNPFVQLLTKGNQNTINQILTSISQQFNQMHLKLINETISSGVSPSTISISKLGLTKSSLSGTRTSNQSTLDKYTADVNLQASIREYLIRFTLNLTSTTANTIKIQAKSLVELTQSTNQLTRTTLIIASDRCFQLSKATRTIADQILFEDVQMIVTQLIQCASHLLTAVNAPLQGRTMVLEKDFVRSTEFPTDYETDLEFEWTNIKEDRNLFYQKQLAKQLVTKLNEMIDLLTDGLNIHLNLGQTFEINQPTIFMSLQTVSPSSFQTLKTYSIDNVHIRLPSMTTIDSNRPMSFRVRFSAVQPLASFGNSNTNLSRSISMELIDKHGNEVSMRKLFDHRFELIIPRDPQMDIPPMFLQNVIENSSNHQLIFNLHYIEMENLGNVSIHLEFESFNRSLSYLLIYRFDQAPILNHSLSQIDGWTRFCSSNLTNTNLFTFFIDNLQTSTRSSVIFGLRELNSTEVDQICSNITLDRPPITNRRYSFTSNYKIRLYSSSCLYLDDESQWRSDGLKVGPLTNLSQTHCLSMKT